MRPLLVLRPEPGASATMDMARAAGLAAWTAPLFAIHAVEPDWSGVRVPPDALLLTSANAARALGELLRRPDEGWRLSQPIAAPAREMDPRLRGDDGYLYEGNPSLFTRPVYAVGEATAAAARAAGFPHVVTGAGDAAAIVARAAADGATRLLHLAGREHHPVAHPDVKIDRVIVYAAEAATALPAAARAALDAGAVALLHSPRAAALFARLLDDARLSRAGVAVAALSPAVATAAGTGWAACAIADRPTDAALLAAAGRVCEETAI